MGVKSSREGITSDLSGDGRRATGRKEYQKQAESITAIIIRRSRASVDNILRLRGNMMSLLREALSMSQALINSIGALSRQLWQLFRRVEAPFANNSWSYGVGREKYAENWRACSILDYYRNYEACTSAGYANWRISIRRAKYEVSINGLRSNEESTELFRRLQNWFMHM